MGALSKIFTPQSHSAAGLLTLRLRRPNSCSAHKITFYFASAKA
jgi:hypothetical protein